jgi:hypothetical protein
MATYFVSGHLDLTPEEFREHYVPKLVEAIQEGADFVVGDAPGADALAQAWLAQCGALMRVFHMKERPRHAIEHVPLVGGFQTDDERDTALTQASTHDIAWLRTGRWPHSGTARNLGRRQEMVREADRESRRALPRFVVDEAEVYPVLFITPASERESWRTTAPIPADLVERFQRAKEEANRAQREIEEWIARQENDPV